MPLHSATGIRSAIALAAFLLPILSGAQTFSELWGEQGELWNPEDSRLKNFTNVGYKQGDVPIPNWPVGVNVLDFGAIPDDGKDDSQAFIDAIAACPDNHAVAVPNGRYRITQQIRVGRDNFVLRGEDLYKTVLWFPKNLSEVYPKVDYDGSYGHGSGFYYVKGGVQRSMENLTFEFREQPKMGHWEWKGQDAVFYGGGVKDSWIRNIYFRNVDHGISMGGAENVSVLNIIFDHYIGRPDVIGSSGRSGWVGHVGIGLGKAKNCLFHNVEFKGNYFHDFDIINVPNGSVVSNVTGPDSAPGSFALHHHGQGARNNLYTNIYGGPIAGLKDSQRQASETHWNFRAKGRLDPKTVPYATQNNHVFVGYDTDLETKVTDTLWYEAIDPAELQPQNIYLAQLEYFGKPLPEGPPPQPPASTGDLVRINPDHAMGFGGFSRVFQFDLNEIDLESIAHARFRITAERAIRGPFKVRVAPVADDSWARDKAKKKNRPASGSPVDEIVIEQDVSNYPLEFDVTSIVQSEWAGDKVVSISIDQSKTGTYNGFLRGMGGGDAPQLIIEQVPSPVPGPPSAPTGGTTTSKRGHVVLDWEDSPEADVATYNVYRSVNKPGKKHFGSPIASGLDTSEFTDVSIKENRAICEIPSDVTLYYVVTAVDSHGYESPYSEVFSGSALKR